MKTPAPVRPPRVPKPTRPPKPPRPPKARKPREERLPARLAARARSIPWRRVRLTGVPVRVLITMVVVALALFAIGTLRKSVGDGGEDGGAKPQAVVEASLLGRPSASPSPSPSASPSSSPSASPSPDKPGSSPTETKPGGGDDKPPAKDAPPPGSGTYRIKSASNGLCLDDPSRGGDDPLIATGCGSTHTTTGLTELSSGTYNISLSNPDQDSPGCVEADAPSSGMPYRGSGCGGNGQTYHLVKVSDGVWRIKSTDSGLCLTFGGSGSEAYSTDCGSATGFRFV
ncbi:RICIN domain-containing protein [Actinorhabdospora filicis]|uniref:RICIN domain-containing protein n=1 Tax=Actinorhabdospora filicis TaxID=1785913 RepID=UPI002556AA73|nr:hypothetical protein [Actinorhabdospora filicis]